MRIARVGAIIQCSLVLVVATCLLYLYSLSLINNCNTRQEYKLAKGFWADTIAVGLDAYASKPGNLGVGKDVFACHVVKGKVKCVEIPPGEYSRIKEDLKIMANNREIEKIITDFYELTGKSEASKASAEKSIIIGSESSSTGGNAIALCGEIYRAECEATGIVCVSSFEELEAVTKAAKEKTK